MLTKENPVGASLAPPDRVEPRGDYETMPYLSLPIAYTQPAHLAALATLHGLAAPAPGQARVLELGCASGGNLIPLAARFPSAQFVGIDLSRRQIADGKRRIEAAGLMNIELKQADIGELAVAREQFDYVICHGVFSWVPAAVQDAILRIASECLTPEGIVAISYNVLPGWHQRSIVRDILLHHAGNQGSPHARVAKARAILAQLAQASQNTGPYGRLLRHEAELLALKPDSYILGEFLAADNSPCSFQDFAGKAARHGLAFLCEADLGAGARELLTPEALQNVTGLGAGDTGLFEQYLDIFSGRPFRRSILVKSQRVKVTPATINPQRMLPLHVSARLHPAPARDKQRTYAFADARGRRIYTRLPSLGHALDRLSEAFPGTLPVRSLAGDGPERGRVAKALYDLTLEGRATVSALPLDVGHASDARPRVWPLARAEAAAGMPGVTSLRHVTVALPKVGVAIAAQLNGSRNQEAVTQWLVKAFEAGTVNVPEPDPSPAAPGKPSLAALAAVKVAQTLQTLGDCGVLAPSTKRAK